jgi:pimeloyl-ACP methyl ester carboxylesterase
MNHLVVAMDLRGRGRSEQPASGYSIDHHCRDISSVLSGLGVGSCALMGHSLGALIALAYGAKHPEQVDRMILVDGGGVLSEEQRKKVLDGIKPSLERLGKVFPSFDSYREFLQKSHLFQQWSDAMDIYLRHEVEEVEGGVRSRIRASAIEEELLNLQEFDIAGLYAQIRCPVLILRAKKGMLRDDDILLQEDVLEKMLEEIPGAEHLDVVGANHYTIMFQDDAVRDLAIKTFLVD